MMAAGRAAARGKRVLLLEKNKTLGKKLLITGGGRCNVTNNKPEVRVMLERYKKSKQFLFSAFSQFAVEDTVQFFEERGLLLKEENEGRLFPVSNSAQSVWDVLVEYMRKGGVEVRSGAEVAGLSQQETGRVLVHLKDKTTLEAKACVVATGGKSRPETGSTGEGFRWLKKLGHTIVENDFALVPVALKDDWAKKLGGVTLSGVKISLFQDSKKIDAKVGRLLFTHFGVSGPTVLNMSRTIGEYLGYGDVELRLDLFPTLDHSQLKEQLQALLIGESNKKLKNVLGTLIPKALAPGVLEMAGIDGETPNHSVKSADRTKLVSLLKALPLHVEGLLGADKAIVSSGGVVLPEIDFKTMQSRLVSNLYLVGDVLNIDRPSGGYSLQLCWTTGYVAGDTL
jgi:hypothetical protein